MYYKKNINKLEKKNIRVTKGREKILKVMLQCHHFTPLELKNLVNEQYKEIGIATVYRTITLFEEAKVISKRVGVDNITYYEIIKEEEGHNHHHLICSNCNKIIDMKDDLLEQMEKIISLSYEFEIKNHNVDFYGICKQCNNTEDMKIKDK